MAIAEYDQHDGLGLAELVSKGEVSAEELLEEAIARANDTPYGLSAGVFSNDVKRCHRVARRLRAGTVWINVFNFVFPEAPYGGYKQSGLGRELGVRSIEEYTEVKNVVVDLSPSGFDWYGGS